MHSISPAHSIPSTNLLADPFNPGQVLLAQNEHNSPDYLMSRKIKKPTPRRAPAKTELREDSPPYHVNGAETREKFRFIDLFCGIGGFRLAFERAGAKCVFSSDWDKHSQITYAANFGEAPHGDIHEVAVADIPQFDILCAGFPCQPFSIAGVSKKLSLGRKHGFEDVKQGNLFFDLAAMGT